MVFRIQNSDFSTRIASLYGSQPSSVVFACKTATLRPELLVSVGSRPHLWFFACKTATLRPKLQVPIGPRPHLLFYAVKTATLAPELQVSIGPSPHLWFLHEKQRLLDQSCKSLLVPALICGFYMKNSDFWIRITSLQGSQNPPVVFACKIA